ERCSPGTARAVLVRGEDHHVAVGLLALGLAAQAGRRDGAVDDLPLERGHRLQRPGLAALGHLRRGVRADPGERLAPALAVAADVQHQPAAVPGPPVHREPGQLLQRLQDFAVLTDQLVQSGADHGDHGPVALDVHVDVAVEVGDVQQALDVVRGDVALVLQGLDVDGLLRSLRDGDAAALLGVIRVAVAHSVLTPLPTRSDPDPSALLPRATAGALRPRLLLRLLTLDLRLFDRLGSGLLALAQQPLGRPVGGTALGRALRLGLLAA